LHRRLEEVSGLQQRLREQTESLAVQEKSVAQRWAERETAKLKELDRRCDLVLEKFEAQAKETIEKIGADKKALRQVGKLKRELREEIETTVLSTRDESRQGELARPKIVEGARVRVKGLREPARVRRMLAGDLIEVEAGFMKLRVSADDVMEVLVGAAGPPPPRRVSFDPAPLDLGAVSEINLIGQRAEEALSQVEKFLDNAMLADASRVRIVHGHGMGILRRAIAEFLSKRPDVEKFYAADQNQGGAGATIVDLKG
jgi:DNA mismatch repair protein MutS2